MVPPAKLESMEGEKEETDKKTVPKNVIIYNVEK